MNNLLIVVFAFVLLLGLAGVFFGKFECGCKPGEVYIVGGNGYRKQGHCVNESEIHKYGVKP